MLTLLCTCCWLAADIEVCIRTVYAKRVSAYLMVMFNSYWWCSFLKSVKFIALSKLQSLISLLVNCITYGTYKDMQQRTLCAMNCYTAVTVHVVGMV